MNEAQSVAVALPKGRYRKVDVRIWNDAKFRGLSDQGKLAFLMLLTHPHMTPIGAMRATLAGLGEELGWRPEAFREAFAEALRKGMVEHDQRACFVGLPRFLEYNRPESPNVVKSWAGSIDLLPECEHKTRLLLRCKAYAQGLGEAFRQAFAEASAKAIANQEQEQEPEQEPKDSVPDGPGGAAAVLSDPGEVWKAGKSLLIEQGVSRDQAGSFIGGLIGKHGEPIVLDSVRAALVEQPQGARAWITAACQRTAGQSRKPPTGKHSGFNDKKYEDGFQA